MIVPCQFCFRHMQKLNKEHQCAYYDKFDCETYTFCVEFVQKIFIPIRLRNSISMNHFQVTILQVYSFRNMSIEEEVCFRPIALKYVKDQTTFSVRSKNVCMIACNIHFPACR